MCWVFKLNIWVHLGIMNSTTSIKSLIWLNFKTASFLRKSFFLWLQSNWSNSRIKAPLRWFEQSVSATVGIATPTCFEFMRWVIWIHRHFQVTHSNLNPPHRSQAAIGVLFHSSLSDQVCQSQKRPEVLAEPSRLLQCEHVISKISHARSFNG